MKKRKMRVRDITETALFAAVICVLAPLAVPVGPVPVTLATLGVYLAAAVLGPARGTAAVAVYILLGAAGVPVFSAGNAGVSYLAGATGGYIIGYLPLAFITGFVARVDRLGEARAPIGMVLGTAALYLLGTAWFAFVTDYTFVSALPVCVIPFLPGDALKAVAVSVVAPAIRRGIAAVSYERA
ncbi:MAG: biotin transporter BioY [Oscillospiraceae bacterium]|nr:biotin transporter BioY [Oscillospiraceae bacterium]